MRLTAAVLTLTLLAAPAAAGIDPFTQTAGGVRPMLDEICSKTVAQAEKPAFVARMSARHGFDFQGDGFVRTGDDGKLEVTLTGVGCAFRVEGKAAMVAEADRVLQAWARGKRLNSQVTDVTTSGEEGRRIERERTARGRLSLTWQVFDNFNGRDRPSRLEGVYSTHVH